MRKKVLLLGASGGVTPRVVPGLAADYDLRLADILLPPQPGDLPIAKVDITRYEDVLEAAAGVDAILNFTVIRGDPTQSFHVNVMGAWHVMMAAAELGIGKVIHTGPQLLREDYEWDFDLDDPPAMAGTGYYTLTKMLSMEICRACARAHGIQTICFLFAGVGDAFDREQIAEMRDFPAFHINGEDLQRACRLALEIESVPDHFQDFNMLSYSGQGKYNSDKARRILGFQPLKRWEEEFGRPMT